MVKGKESIWKEKMVEELDSNEGKVMEGKLRSREMSDLKLKRGEGERKG